ncbi:hypothetical protein AR457_01275 [Streptomyces agglomeratus]|uniref:STAS domain-containing protein n=1 Tax=Streptomyces agglomeratus TaxID=285458 RepID=UPI0008541B4F|nr:STAS domain-containing protein [Streptomyces agglomeratus]OEJ42939.1 hypothetical protein AR457_01275 [Streptomyces agglomeratus]
MHIARTLLVNQNLETRMGLTLVGELDRESVPLLQTALQNCLQPVGRGDIEINVEGLTFCDVSGLNALLAAAHRAGGTGNSVRLHGPLPAVVRLLEVTDTCFLTDGPATAPALRLVPTVPLDQ